MRVWLIILLVALAAIRGALPLTTTVVLGCSMEPALRSGQICVLDRGYYRSRPVLRGDVVVLRLDSRTFIKRIYALPGDRLWLLEYDDRVGTELLSPARAARLRRLKAAGALPGGRVTALTIPPGSCFVLGDNSEVSLDSRDFGPVPLRAIIGRAML